ncbi:hypothetical protein FB45DRAFT_820627 [Roridomyces roridus]|uniref:Rhodopsin domain-containing protein n=1 Tax=Roridomyces roridus TaxID=1738132 RepID=A0AAD7G2V6_9AGAR|nr:hypothetical protein FB45DRAFT_820627 [Roridomyces roridus]
MVSETTTLEILLCTLIPFACLVTYFRLYIRWTRSKLWWDDLWAFVSTLFSITVVVGLMLHVTDQVHPRLRQKSKIAIYYITSQSFVAAIWTSRISLLHTVIRMAVGRLRKILWFVAVGFGITWAVLFAQTFWVCEAEPGWKQSKGGQCALGESVAITQVITDVISDAILIVAPLKLIYRVRLERSLKLRLMAVFATTAITTAVSIYHAYIVFRFGGFKEVMAATIQIAISLVVANLAVVVAYAFRLHAQGSDGKWDDEATEPTSDVETIGGTNRVKRSKSSRALTTTTFGPGSFDAAPVRVQVDISKTRGWVGDDIESDSPWTGGNAPKKQFELRALPPPVLKTGMR